MTDNTLTFPGTALAQPALAMTPAQRIAVLENQLREAKAENERLAGDLALAQGEVMQLRDLLTPGVATSGPVYAWVAGYGDRRFVGYWRNGRLYLPGCRVVEDMDILRTVPVAA